MDWIMFTAHLYYYFVEHFEEKNESKNLFQSACL